MKFLTYNSSFQPKKMIGLTLFAVAILMLVPKFSAQPAHQPIPTPVPTGEATSCNINGAAYPVDGSGQIWAIGNEGKWFVVGHIASGANGPIALRNDGTSYPAVCE